MRSLLRRDKTFEFGDSFVQSFSFICMIGCSISVRHLCMATLYVKLVFSAKRQTEIMLRIH